MRVMLAVGLTAILTGFGITGADARAGGRGYSSGGGYVRVRGYTTARGTYVAPHYRSRPDGILSNNLSYRSGGSYGQPGTVRLATATEEAGSIPSLPAGSGQGYRPVASEPWCPPPQKIVGSGAGFCLIN